MEAQHERSESLEAGQGRPGALRISGIAGIVGGLCLTASAIMQALQPPGCIAEGCVGRTYRSAGQTEEFLIITGVLLIAGATLGFLALISAGSRAGRVVRVGALVAAYAIVFSVALLNSALFWVGLILMILGVLAYVSVGVGLSVSHELPSWSGVLLAVSALLLIVANDQNERILFVVPFGVTWMVLGVLLWTAAFSTRNQNARVQLA